MDRSTAGGSAVYTDMPAVLAHDVVAQGQAQPGAHTGLLGGKKRIEYPLQVLFIDPASVVLDQDIDHGVVFFRKYFYSVFGSGRVTRIAQHINEYLQQSLAISPHTEQRIAAHVEVQVPGPFGEPDQFNGLFNTGGQIKSGILGVKLAAVAESDQRFDDVPDPPGLIQNLIHRWF